MTQPQITVQNLSFSNIINNISLSFADNKIAIVGRNGVGKTTLLRLLVGELIPDTGSVIRDGTFAYCPQNSNLSQYMTVADLLGVDGRLLALKNIENGSVEEIDFELINNDWNLRERIQVVLQQFNLENLELECALNNLSGGELTRLWLARSFLSSADFLIFDEPTNNLDSESRRLLYKEIKNCSKGIIVVTHDRELLMLMEQIVELSSLGCVVYGGDFELYLQQKNILELSRRHDLLDAEKELRIIKQSVQKSREKHAQRASKGRAARRDGNQAKIILNSFKARSEKTQNKLATRERLRVDAVQAKLKAAKESIENNQQIKVDLPTTNVPSRKMIFTFTSLFFSYAPEKQLLNDFNFSMYGPERVAMVGRNGGGKTTIVKLLMNELQPQSGKITLGVERISYLDQGVKTLAAELSILDNFKQLNSESNEAEARKWLAAFLFRGDKVLQIVSSLSGGEKLRAALACILPGAQAPQLLILDEPTNHLDLDSIASLESILNCYQGALLVISHDRTFLQNVGVEKRLLVY